MEYAMWSFQEAKNRLSALVDAAVAGRPQEVSRRGKPAVVVLSAEEFHRLVAEAAGHRESFAEHLPGFPGSEVDRLKAKPRDLAFDLPARYQ